MPSLLWVENVVSPSHHLAGLDSRGKSVDLDRVLGVSVSGCACEEHQRALVGAPRFKFDDPVLSDLLILWVVVQVLALGVVDARDLCAIDLYVPRIGTQVE